MHASCLSRFSRGLVITMHWDLRRETRIENKLFVVREITRSILVTKAEDIQKCVVVEGGTECFPKQGDFREK